MDYRIRPARTDDVNAIAEFTTDTFEWGDYITEVLPHWMEEPFGKVMVAVDENDQAIALGRGAMMSDTEMWLQGTRVSKAWRRQGIASAIGESLVEWAAGRGARVTRLLTEAWNEPAQRQVENSGFRRSGVWVVGAMPISDAKPAVANNGGQRAKARRKLEIAHSSEAAPAWVSWRSGPLVGPARGLRASGWQWAQLTAEHLIQAGKKGALWSSQAGWIVTRRDREVLYVDWLECGPDDIDNMMRSIIDLAYEQHAEFLRVTIPQIDWTAAALERAGCETHQMFIYERPL